MEVSDSWIVIIRGEADGKDIRVALDFQDAESLLSPSHFVVGETFLTQLMDLLQIKENWLVKTVIDEVRTPQEHQLPSNIPLFVLLTKSHPRGLSAGVLFLAEDIALRLEEVIENPPDTIVTVIDPTMRFIVAGLSPVGFAAACAEDSRLFTRFISRLLKRPEAFAEVSLLLPRESHPFHLNSS